VTNLAYTNGDGLALPRRDRDGDVTAPVPAVALSNHELVPVLVTALPVVGQLPMDSTGGNELFLEAGTTAVVLVAAMALLLKPQLWCILDIAELASKRVVLGVITLAAIGYFTCRLPRQALMLKFSSAKRTSRTATLLKRRPTSREARFTRSVRIRRYSRERSRTKSDPKTRSSPRWTA